MRMPARAQCGVILPRRVVHARTDARTDARPVRARVPQAVIAGEAHRDQKLDNRRVVEQLHLEEYERPEIVSMTGWSDAKVRRCRGLAGNGSIPHRRT